MVRVQPLPVYSRPLAPPAPQSKVSANVWQVEARGDFEIYSNGLRIENRFAVSTRPRSYRVYRTSSPQEPAGDVRTRPAGIVFHTTESQLEPFEPAHNRVLLQVGESLIEYVRRRHCYHFLIDRFGRVFRIVKETDVAEHAGYSVWSDKNSLYVNLNESFLGVSFEGRTEPGQEQPTISPAQVRAAAMLIEMLRSRYAIAAENCVTHAQVSVNPSNLRIGYHTDWASSFPFEQVGLPDNYTRPLPALVAFGFQADSEYLRLGGPRLSQGVALSEEEVRAQAEAMGMSISAWRRELQHRYRQHSGGVLDVPGMGEAGAE